MKCLHLTMILDKEYRTICPDCGDEFCLIINDIENAYFEILHKEEDGSFTAFHRDFQEQLRLFEENPLPEVH